MADSSNSAPKTEMISMIDYAEIINETGKYILGIGKIEGTNDLYITLNCITVSTSSNPSEGNSSNVVLYTTVFAMGQRLMSNDTSLPIKTRYLNFIKKQYNMSLFTRKFLHKFVKDFKCIVGEESESENECDYLMNIHY